jgi:hypothetical protein
MLHRKVYAYRFCISAGFKGLVFLYIQTIKMQKVFEKIQAFVNSRSGAGLAAIFLNSAI